MKSQYFLFNFPVNLILKKSTKKIPEGKMKGINISGARKSIFQASRVSAVPRTSSVLQLTFFPWSMILKYSAYKMNFSRTNFFIHHHQQMTVSQNVW